METKLENMSPELMKELAQGKVLVMRTTTGNEENPNGIITTTVSLEDKERKPTAYGML
jgi:hypothetical protein